MSIINNDIKEIFELLDNKCLLVGGCVRDYILYTTLAEDVDIATKLLPDEVIKRLKVKYDVKETGLKHGTVSIFIDNHTYEITTLRCDEITDGRHAQVKFNESYELDSTRRDLTINGLYMDLDGKIYDYHNGKKDLENNYVRFIGDPYKRIHEDYLRILRFIRFASRFGNYDVQHMNICIELSHNLTKISKERITNEWRKIYLGKNFQKILEVIVPILKVIGLDISYKENIFGLSLFGFTSLFIQKSNLLIFSNVENKYINDLKILELNSQSDAIKHKRKFGEKFVKDKMIIENKYFDTPELGDFPINGNDIISKGITGPLVKECLDKLYNIWIDKLGLITKEDLLKII